MMQPAASAIGHDAFLILSARSIECGRDHGVLRIENLLWIDSEHVAPIFPAAHVESWRHIGVAACGNFLQFCDQRVSEIVVLSLICLRVPLLPESLCQDDRVLQSAECPEVMTSHVPSDVLV